MGAKTHLDCRVSNDMTGQIFARDLHDSGVHSALDSKPLPDGITGKCLVFVTPDADRTMNTFLGVSGDLDCSDIDGEALRASNAVYLEGYLASADNTRDAAIEARYGDRQPTCRFGNRGPPNRAAAKNHHILDVI